MKQRLILLFIGNALATFLAAPLQAATHTWAGVGLSGFWSLPANWAGNNPPTAGEADPEAPVTDDDAELAAMIKPASGTVAKGSADDKHHG